MPLTNCERNLILTGFADCVISFAAGETKFAITDTKRHVLVPTLSTQDNAKLLEHLKSGFKRAINWKKYQSKVSIESQNQYLDYLIDPTFQGVNRLFIHLIFIHRLFNHLKIMHIEQDTQDVFFQK